MLIEANSFCTLDLSSIHVDPVLYRWSILLSASQARGSKRLSVHFVGTDLGRKNYVTSGEDETKNVKLWTALKAFLQPKSTHMCKERKTERGRERRLIVKLKAVGRENDTTIRCINTDIRTLQRDYASTDRSWLPATDCRTQDGWGGEWLVMSDVMPSVWNHT